MDHHPLTMIPVPTIDLPAIPISFANMPTEETMTMIGEMVQNRPRAPSLTAPSSNQPMNVNASASATVQAECGTMSVMDSICQPISTSAIHNCGCSCSLHAWTRNTPRKITFFFRKSKNFRFSLKISKNDTVFLVFYKKL